MANPVLLVKAPRVAVAFNQVADVASAAAGSKPAAAGDVGKPLSGADQLNQQTVEILQNGWAECFGTRFVPSFK
jgi:hypothetical protein